MARLMVDIFIRSLKYDVEKEESLGIHCYHGKAELSSKSKPYLRERKSYDESRGILWELKNKRPERLLDSMYELESLIQKHEVIKCLWRNDLSMQLFLSNGFLVTLLSTEPYRDIERIYINKSLVGKFSAELFSDVLIKESFILCTYLNKSRIDVIQSARPTSKTDKKSSDKFYLTDFKITSLDLPGISSCRRKRKLSVNCDGDMVLVWWQTSDTDVWPWTPSSSDDDKCNLIALKLIGMQNTVVASDRTEYHPLFVEFSNIYSTDLHVLEVYSLPSSSEMHLSASLYQIRNDKIVKSSSINFNLKSGILSYSRSHEEDKFLISCEDSTLVVISSSSPSIHVRSKVIPNMILWHKSDLIFFVANSRGDIQVFDVALNTLHLWCLSEGIVDQPVIKLGSLFSSPVTLKHLEWIPANNLDSCHNSLMLLFDGGLILHLELGLSVARRGKLLASTLVQEYLIHGQIDQAINILHGLSWQNQYSESYSCLSIIINHLLKSPLTTTSEAKVQEALGSFYAPKQKISDDVVILYREPIGRLARRFFHQLLRYSRFEKAFLLSVDLGARDLFMDIHYFALDMGEEILAQVAYQKAEEIECRSPGMSSVEDCSDDEFHPDPLISIAKIKLPEETQHISRDAVSDYLSCEGHEKDTLYPTDSSESSSRERLSINDCSGCLSSDFTLNYNHNSIIANTFTFKSSNISNVQSHTSKISAMSEFCPCSHGSSKIDAISESHPCSHICSKTEATSASHPCSHICSKTEAISPSHPCSHICSKTEAISTSHPCSHICSKTEAKSESHPCSHICSKTDTISEYHKRSHHCSNTDVMLESTNTGENLFNITIPCKYSISRHHAESGTHITNCPSSPKFTLPSEKLITCFRQESSRLGSIHKLHNPHNQFQLDNPLTQSQMTSVGSPTFSHQHSQVRRGSQVNRGVNDQFTSKGICSIRPNRTEISIGTTFLSCDDMSYDTSYVYEKNYPFSQQSKDSDRMTYETPEIPSQPLPINSKTAVIRNSSNDTNHSSQSTGTPSEKLKYFRNDVLLRQINLEPEESIQTMHFGVV